MKRDHVMLSCPTTAALDKLLDSDEGTALSDDMAAHLGECPLCQQALSRFAGGSTERVLRRPADDAPGSQANSAFMAGLKDKVRGELTRSIPPDFAAIRHSIPGYELLECIGHGATAAVYRARHLSLDRLVALKVILAGKHAAGTTLARLRTEAESVARLQHPHIVQIFEIGATDGLPFLSLEYVAGGTLSQYLAAARPSLPDAARFVAVLARAIQYAHDRGIIHRDLKPANILLAVASDQWLVASENQNPSSLATSHSSLATTIPKIADFGLARRLEEDQHLTETGALLGTPRYMAPEQAQPRQRQSAVGPAADIHALGAILYEMIVGRAPFEAATSMATLLQVIQQEPLAPRRLRPEVPVDLETIVLKCLQKDPHHRYPTALALAQDLESFLAGKPITARPIGSVERLWRWVRRFPALAALLAGFVVVTLSALTVVSLALLDARDSRNKEAEQRHKAETALTRSERTLYFSNIAQSRAQFLLNNIPASANLLGRCPSKLRGWEWRYLHGLLHNDLLTIAEHTGNYVGGVAFSPDGRWVAIGTGTPFQGRDEGAVHVHDSRTGALRWRSTKPRFQVAAVAFSPDGRHLVSGGGSFGLISSPVPGELHVWDAATGKLVKKLIGHLHRITAVAFNRDGSRLASTSNADSVRVWDTKEWRELWCGTPEGHTLSVAFSPDSRFVVAAAEQRGRLLDGATGKTLAFFPDMHWYVALSPDGKRLASSQDGGVLVWDSSSLWSAPWQDKASAGVPNVKLPLLHSIIGLEGWVHGLAFSPDGQTLATGGVDGVVRTWNPADGRERLVLRGHHGRIAAVAFHPKGHTLASGGTQPGDVKLWDLGRPPEYAVPLDFSDVGADVMAVGFVNDDRELAALGINGHLRRWQRATGAQREVKINAFNDWRVPATTAVFSGDGRRALTIVRRGEQKINVWDLQASAPVKVLSGPAGDLWHLACDAKGERVVATAAARKDTGFVHEKFVWNATSGAVLSQERTTDRYLTALAVRRDGAWFAEGWMTLPKSGSKAEARSEVRLVEFATGAVRRLVGPKKFVRALAFDHEGNRLAGSFERGTLQVWDTATGEALYPKPLACAEMMWALAFSPDSARLAGVGRERVQLWDVVSGQDLLFLRGAGRRPGDNGFNPCIAWSRDGALLAASNWNRTVSVWDATDSIADRQARLRRHARERVRSLSATKKPEKK